MILKEMMDILIYLSKNWMFELCCLSKNFFQKKGFFNKLYVMTLKYFIMMKSHQLLRLFCHKAVQMFSIHLDYIYIKSQSQ